MASTAAGKQRIPKVAKVKNKAPAEVQITAEQLLREAKERELELLPPPPQQKITDVEELNDYKLRKRKTFEDNIRKNRTVISNWIKYAQWEESLKEIQRARSIYERALDVDYRNVTLWLKYAEMEMKNRQVNHARNIWDRAITTLPRVNQFWYKYTYMEEMLGNVAGSRQVFERWMEWQPEEQAWHSYINFELRYKEVDRARTIYERFVIVHPDVKNWIKYARFEEKHSYFAHARKVYERAVEFFGEEHMDEHLYVAFAKFEENQKEFERVRVIYKYALDRIPKHEAQNLFKNYTIFEKKFGDRRGIEDIIVSKRRFQYEEEVKANPHNYDAWFDYLRLVESDTDAETVREVYERAIANVPPVQEKRHWKRYIYLWINYALYEELEAKDAERTRQVYQACIELIPHKKFTFAKIWLLYAQFEIRQKNLPLARRALVILNWSYNCENLIGAESCMKNSWNLHQKTAHRGLNLLSWRPSWGILTEPVPYMSWLLASPGWTCLRFFGSPSLTLRLSKRNTRKQETFTAGCCSGHSTLRSGSALLSSSCLLEGRRTCQDAGRFMKRPIRQCETVRRRRRE
ncbi:crooked neck-like protein 1 isoform X2 [Calypte anna]|uniref:crooked neck-like protein 1 isoform X2 n=1 Tax=Calypte anna TaxID=9244 RepID=UPI0011C47476|nr:crooked neck-like protein 1 isoform X2 [Calypte anna]